MFCGVERLTGFESVKCIILAKTYSNIMSKLCCCCGWCVTNQTYQPNTTTAIKTTNQTTSCQQTKRIFRPLAFLQNTSHAYSINEISIFFAKAIFYVAREKAGWQKSEPSTLWGQGFKHRYITRQLSAFLLLLQFLLLKFTNSLRLCYCKKNVAWL